MQISPKFNLVLSNKIEDKSNIKKHNFIKQNEQKDTFTSTTSAVSFKGKPPIPAQLEKMLKSKKFWEILGATVTAASAALWNQLTNNGENDIDLTEDQIAEMIKANYPEELKNKPEEINTQDENIIEAELVENNDADEKEKAKLTTMKLEPSKQSAKPVLSEKDLAMAEKIKELYAKGYDVKYMSNELGVSTTKIYNLMNAVGMNPPSKQRLIDANNLTKEEVVKLYEDNLGKSDKAISCILGISENEMKKIRQKYDIPAPRRITSAKKLEAIKKAKEEEKAKEIENKPTENAQENTETKPEVKNEETEVKNDKKETAVETSNIDTQDLNKAVLELTNQKLSARQIATKLGISTATVKSILIEEIKNRSNKLKELADKGYTLEQAAEELGKDIRTVKRDADRKGIVFNVEGEEQQTNQPENTAETEKETAVTITPELEKSTKKEIQDLIEVAKTLKHLKKTEHALFFDLFNVTTELKYDEEIENEIKSIQDKYKQQFELLNKIDTANMKTAIRKFSKKSDNAELTPQGYIRYSTEDLLMRYIASQYRIFTETSNDKEASIANRKRRGLITEPVLNDKNIDKSEMIDKYFDETIPENDPLFEKFVECFDFKSCVMSLKKYKQEYVNEIMKEAKAEDLLVKLNNMNAPYVELDIQSLYLILNSTIDYKVPAFPLSIPKFKNGESINDTQKELMQTIEGFKIRKLAKEYVDLVHIYNTYCGQDYNEVLANSLLSDLKAIESPKEITEEELDELTSIINSYKLGTIPDTRPSDTPDDFETFDIRNFEITEDMTSEEKKKFFTECIKILDAKSNDNLGKGLQDLIADFYFDTETLEDLKNLQKFIIILDDIKNGLSTQDAFKKCKNEKIATEKGKNKALKKAKEKAEEDEMGQLIELEEIVKNKIQQIYNNYAINTETNNLFIRIQQNLSKFNAKKLENLKEDLKILEDAIITNVDVDKTVQSIEAEYFSDDNVSEEEANEYKIALENNMPFEDEYKEIIRKKLNEEKSIDMKTAITSLKKIDLYQALSADDKTHLTKILTIFDKDAKGVEKRLLETILENEYIKTNTVIDNNFINKTIELAPAVKKEIWSQYSSDRVFILLKSENVAKNKSITKGGNGDEGFEIRKSDDNPVWLKICGNFGDIRLTGKIKDKNIYFIKNLETNRHD